MHGNKSALSVTHIVHVTAACKKQNNPLVCSLLTDLQYMYIYISKYNMQAISLNILQSQCKVLLY